MALWAAHGSAITLDVQIMVLRVGESGDVLNVQYFAGLILHRETCQLLR